MSDKNNPPKKDKDLAQQFEDHNIQEDFDFTGDPFAEGNQENARPKVKHNDEPPRTKSNILIFACIIVLIVYGMYKFTNLFNFLKSASAPASNNSEQVIVPVTLHKVEHQAQAKPSNAAPENNAPKTAPDAAKPTAEPAKAEPAKVEPKKEPEVPVRGQRARQSVTTMPDVVSTELPATLKDDKKVISDEAVAATAAPTIMNQPAPVNTPALKPAVESHNMNNEAETKIKNLDQKIDSLDKKISSIEANISNLKASSKQDQEHLLSDELKTTLNTLVGYMVDYSKNLEQLSAKVKQNDMELKKIASGMPHQGQHLASHSMWKVDAIIPGRAWLRDSKGKLISVADGDNIPGVGKVLDIDARKGQISTESGVLGQ